MEIDRFKQLYIPMRMHIMTLCRSYLKQTEEAEDATQEIYLKLWSMRDKLEDVLQPKAFVMRVTRNHCFDRLKSRKEELIRDEETIDYYQEQENDLMEQLTAREQIDEIRKWLHIQKEPKKSVFLKRHFQGRTIEEIATDCSLTEVNVRVMLSRMRKEVKTMFEK